MVFPFKEKELPHKFLCSCVVVFPLCLLKFSHSYIKFFPTILSHQESKFDDLILASRQPRDLE